MTAAVFTARAWKNGRHAAGTTYGFQLAAVDRDAYFRRSWRVVTLTLPGVRNPIDVLLSDSFWRDCPELRHVEIRNCFRGFGAIPWTAGRPPRFRFQAVGMAAFNVVSVP